MQQPQRYTHAQPQRIICTRCGANYVLKTTILPENYEGRCKCGGAVESLGVVGAVPREHFAHGASLGEHNV